MHTAPHKLPNVVVAAMAVLMLLGAYVGGYWLALDRGVYVPNGYAMVYDEYQVAAEWLFWPAHKVDRMIWPAYWRGDAP